MDKENRLLHNSTMTTTATATTRHYGFMEKRKSLFPTTPQRPLFIESQARILHLLPRPPAPRGIVRLELHTKQLYIIIVG